MQHGSRSVFCPLWHLYLIHQRKSHARLPVLTVGIQRCVQQVCDVEIVVRQNGVLPCVELWNYNLSTLQYWRARMS